MGHQLSKLEQFLRCVEVLVLVSANKCAGSGIEGGASGLIFADVVDIDALDLPDGEAADAAWEYVSWKSNGELAEPDWHAAWKQRLKEGMTAGTRLGPDKPGQRLNVAKCARCGTDHKNLLFRLMDNPSEPGIWWATCPKTGDPVMMCPPVEEDRPLLQD